jgi:hypothetical protein
MPIHLANGQVVPNTTGLPAEPSLGPQPPVFVPEPVQGTPGANAYTTTTSTFTVPVGDDATPATLTVKDTSWIAIGQPLFIQTAGTFTAQSIINGNTFTIVNSGLSGNANPGTVIGQGAKVSPGGAGGGGGGDSGLPAAPGIPGTYNLVKDSILGLFWDLVGGDNILSFSLGASSPQVVGTPLSTVGFTATSNVAPLSASIAWSGGGPSGSQVVTPSTTMSGSFSGPFNGLTNGATMTVQLTCIFVDGMRMTPQTIVWAERTFQGVGGAGATGATASGTNAALSGGSAGGTTLVGTAPILNTVGQTFTVAASNQKVYDLVPHTSTPHTYVDASLHIPFGLSLSQTFSFLNEHGVSESWDLYESTYTLTGTYNITRAT